MEYRARRHEAMGFSAVFFGFFAIHFDFGGFVVAALAETCSRDGEDRIRYEGDRNSSSRCCRLHPHCKGDFYGTTVGGSSGPCNRGCGVVFKLSPVLLLQVSER